VGCVVLKDFVVFVVVVVLLLLLLLLLVRLEKPILNQDRVFASLFSYSEA
jgi:hypothetical protein